MNLYEINKELELAMENAIDQETGEINEDLYQKVEELQIAKEEKIENIGCFIKNLRSDAEQLKAEAKSLTGRASSALNKADWLEEYLTSFLNGEKFSSTKVSISYRKSSSVECEDLTKVPEKYLRYKDPELNKTAVKEAIKAGLDDTGCVLTEKTSMIIK